MSDYKELIAYLVIVWQIYIDLLGLRANFHLLHQINSSQHIKVIKNSGFYFTIRNIFRKHDREFRGYHFLLNQIHPILYFWYNFSFL